MGELSDPYYKAAREYFEAAFKGATMVIDKRTLADVIGHVNAGGKPVDTLYIVSHAGDTGFLQFSVDADDLKQDQVTGNQKPNATFAELKEANERGTLPKADTKLIDDKTKIKIKGCDIGRSERTLDELDEAFGGKASVTAPTHAQEFRSGGKGGTPAEHLNRMFVEWPGDVKKDAAERAKAFKAKYPMVPAGRWKGLLAQGQEGRQGQPDALRPQPDEPDRAEGREGRAGARERGEAVAGVAGMGGQVRRPRRSSATTTGTRSGRRRAAAATWAGARRSSRSRCRPPTTS